MSGRCVRGGDGSCVRARRGPTGTGSGAALGPFSLQFLDEVRCVSPSHGRWAAGGGRGEWRSAAAGRRRRARRALGAAAGGRRGLIAVGRIPRLLHRRVLSWHTLVAVVRGRSLIKVISQSIRPFRAVSIAVAPAHGCLDGGPGAFWLLANLIQAAKKRMQPSPWRGGSTHDRTWGGATVKTERWRALRVQGATPSENFSLYTDTTTSAF